MPRPVTQVTAAAWEPLAGLRTLSLSLPRSLSRDSADNVLRACTSLRTLRLQFPAGSVDTAYLARHAERCASLQLLEVTAQRMLFTKTLDGGAGGGSNGAGIAVKVQGQGREPRGSVPSAVRCTVRESLLLTTLSAGLPSGWSKTQVAPLIFVELQRRLILNSASKTLPWALQIP